MTPHYEHDGITIYHGDCRKVMPQLGAGLIDTVVTDPPYHLTTGKKGGTGPASVNLASPYGRARITTGFMGKKWDGGDVAFQPETWAEVSRLCKPGAMLLAFGGTRTYHRLTCAIEDAGWEIRDSLAWMYGTGFPKSHNFGDEQNGFDGWGTALKPAWEPIILAMKPLDGTFTENALTHGVAGLNIDGCRIGDFENTTPPGTDRFNKMLHEQGYRPNAYQKDNGREGEASAGKRYTDKGGTDFAATPGPRGGDPSGRWPANVLLDEAAAQQLDEHTGTLTSGTGAFQGESSRGYRPNAYGTESRPAGTPCVECGDSGGASRFFYTAKVSAAERGDSKHPTMKPLDLMRWLVRLTKTPKGGVVLDPFAGSGTTALACRLEGRECVLIEDEHIDDCMCRIQAKPSELF